MKVIGIDPGSRATGWGVVQEVSGVLSLVECGVICAKGDTFAERISDIYHKLHECIERCAPEEAAVEQVFTSKNMSSALKLAQARGVAIAACASFHLPVFDYEPTLVKKAIVGVGRAEKEQVAFMVGKLLNIKTSQYKLDTTDALGVAICHFSMRRYKQLEMLAKKAK